MAGKLTEPSRMSALTGSRRRFGGAGIRKLQALSLRSNWPSLRRRAGFHVPASSSSNRRTLLEQTENTPFLDLTGSCFYSVHSLLPLRLLRSWLIHSHSGFIEATEPTVLSQPEYLLVNSSQYLSVRMCQYNVSVCLLKPFRL